MRGVFYHGIVDGAQPEHYYNSLFMDRHGFEAEVREIARNWHPLPLAEIGACLADDQPLPDRAVHVSFDDGYASTLIAADILSRHRVPWTLFPVVDTVLDGYRPWFTRVAATVGASSYVRWADGSVADLATPARKWEAAGRIKARVMAAPAAIHAAIVEELLALPGLREPDPPPWPMLGLDEIRELQASGVEIGNHSARHVNLLRCDPELFRAEVEGSRRRLSAALGSDVTAFSYPDGRHNRRVAREVAVGHTVATSVWHPGSATRALALPRHSSIAGDAGRMEWARRGAMAKCRELRQRFAGLASSAR